MDSRRSFPDEAATEAVVVDLTSRVRSVPPPPSSGVKALLAELPGLSSDARQLLEVAAVLAGPFSIDDVAEALGEPIGRVLPALREALADGVVVPHEDLLAFDDQRVADAVVAGIPEPIRQALHRQIGIALLRRGDSGARAAAHLIQGTRPTDRQALSAMDRAARELTATAPRAAAELAVRVLQLTEPGDGDRFPRAETAVEALVAAGRIGEAEQLARETLGTPGAPPGSAARIRLTLCGILFMNGQPARAIAEADSVLAERALTDEQYDAAELGRLLSLLVLNDLAGAAEGAELILAGAERPRGDTALAQAVATLAWIAWDEGRIAIAVGLARAAVQRADRTAVRGQHPRLGLSAMLTAVGEFDEAALLLKHVGDHIEHTADMLWSVHPPLFTARLHLATGRLNDAAAQARVALANADALDTRMFVPVILATLAQVALLRGALREADEYAERCHREPAPPRVWLGPAAYTWTRARIVEARDGPAAAMQILDEEYTRLPTKPILLVEEAFAASWLTRIALAAADRERAASVVRCAEQLAASNPGSASVAAAAAHARGLLDRNVAEIERAATRYRHPWAAASAFEDAGVVLTARGDREEGRRAFERSLATYERAGADRDTARVRSRLRALGIRPTHWTRADRPATGWRSLTGTEQRVATVVAEGLTNAGVAGRLFLSRHTVDYHLRKIFRKLGIRSRSELTRLVVEHDEQSHAEPPGT